MELISLILIFIIVLLMKKGLSKPKNYPPGPLSIPVVGNFMLVGLEVGNLRYRVEILKSLGQKYGPVMAITFGPRHLIILNGYEAVKEAMNREDLACRPEIAPLHKHFYGERIGVFYNDGPEWREQRRFTLRHLRDFGFGRRSMEIYIHEEARTLFETMETEDFDLLHLLPILFIRLLWSIVAGSVTKKEDPKFCRFIDVVLACFRENDATITTFFLPELRYVPFVNTPYNRLIRNLSEMKSYVEVAIDEHEASFDENHMRNFIDVYIKEMRSKPNSSFTRDQLSAICMDLFGAATESTSATLAYALRHLIQNIEIQDKLRKEIHTVVGTERLPAMDDVPSLLHYSGDIHSLAYTQAVLAETLRLSSPIPIVPLHSVKQDTNFMGYVLPKDCSILLNLYSGHMDPNIWGDPETFRPERFLTGDGRYQKNEHLLAFGAGSRACMGESLARNSMMLYLAALIQRYQFQSQGTQPLDGHIEGFTTSPTHFMMRIERIKA